MSRLGLPHDLGLDLSESFGAGHVSGPDLSKNFKPEVSKSFMAGSVSRPEVSKSLGLRVCEQTWFPAGSLGAKIGPLAKNNTVPLSSSYLIIT